MFETSSYKKGPEWIKITPEILKTMEDITVQVAQE